MCVCVNIQKKQRILWCHYSLSETANSLLALARIKSSQLHVSVTSIKSDGLPHTGSAGSAPPERFLNFFCLRFPSRLGAARTTGAAVAPSLASMAQPRFKTTGLHQALHLFHHALTARYSKTMYLQDIPMLISQR